MKVSTSVPIERPLKVPSQFRRWLWAIGVAIPLIWAIVAFGLHPDRGLDLTDEGLYLLEADPPSPTATWATPYGWHTAPVFRLVGYDVAAFRSFGAWTLLLATVLLGLAAFCFGRSQVLTGPPGTPGSVRPTSWLTMLASGVIAVLGGSLYYAGMIRTPSYNWLNVLGSVLAATGALLLLRFGDERSRRGPRQNAALYRHASTATIAAGLFLALPAKPTTPLFFMLLFAPAALIILGIRRSLRAAALIAAYAVAYLGLALVSGLWPLNFAAVFLRVLETPTPNPTQSLPGATVEFLLFPLRGLRAQPFLVVLLALPGLRWSMGRSLPIRTRYAALLSVLIVSVTWTAIVTASLRWVYGRTWTEGFVMRQRDTTPFEVYLDSVAVIVLIAPLLLLIAVAMMWPGIGVGQKRQAAQILFLVFAVMTVWPQGSVLFGGEGAVRFVNAELTTAFLLIYGGLLLGQSQDRAEGGEDHKTDESASAAKPRTLPIVSGTLVLLAFATGFGSGHLPYAQSSLAAALFTAALLLLIGGISDRRIQQRTMLSVAVPVALICAVVWADNQAHPYRTEAMALQRVETPVGAKGAVLKLDLARHQLLIDLDRAAQEAGWQPGTRLLGLAAPWSSTIPWHLGALVPESIMPTLWASPERLEHSLTWWELDGWEDAWILITPEGGPHPELHSITWEQARTVAGALENNFPDDYLRVWTHVDHTDENANYELWRPRA